MHRQRAIVIGAVLLALGYAWVSGAFIAVGGASAPAAPAAQKAGLEKATFAGGCFWCTESDFEKVKGVVSAVSGYTGGRVKNPTYEQVSAGGTGHAESVEILFNPSLVTYEQLLDHFWHNVDPFVADRQFCDRGTQYRPEIFVHTEAQRAAAEASKARVQQRFAQKIVVAITAAGPFYPAEEYHQDYYKTHSVQYHYYRWRCGRDARLKAIWGPAA
jgi:peptide-methionine (S)-S-oxide reductase